jgi:ketosteroid isomerase-like protein
MRRVGGWSAAAGVVALVGLLAAFVAGRWGKGDSRVEASNGRVSAQAAGADAEHEADRQAILKAYEGIREAHLKHDGKAFLAPYDADWLRVSDGEVEKQTKASEVPKVQAYLDGVKFEELKEVEPPRIKISGDGTMAWFVGHVRVKATEKDSKGRTKRLDFDAAWVNVWEKKPEGWRIVVHGDTQKND